MPVDADVTADLRIVFGVLSAFVFVLGTVVGSFLNVAIYRMPLGLSVNKPRRSFCFRCGAPIPAHHNIPVLGYFLLGGRDHACGARFSMRYAMVELLTGLVFLALWLMYNQPGTFSPATLWYFAFASLLIVGTFTDFDHWIIPQSIPRWGAVGAIVAALLFGFFDPHALVARGGPFPAVRMASGDTIDQVLAVLTGPGYYWGQHVELLWWEPVANALIGAIVAPLLLWLLGQAGRVMFGREAMGFGDVELFVLIGATLGAINSVLVLVLASFFGSVAGLTRMIAHRALPDDSPLALGHGYTVSNRDPDEPDEETKARLYAEGLAMDYVAVERAPLTAEVLAAIPADIALRHRVIPLAKSPTSLRLAVEDPYNGALVQDLRKATGLEIEFVIGQPSVLQRLARKYYGGGVDPEPDETPVWRRYAEVAGVLPVPPPTSHLPFIPWITMGALTLLIFHAPLIALLDRWLTPTFE